MNLFLALLMLGFISCKKEVIEVRVDAYAQLDIEVKHQEDVFALLFTLQPFPYEEIGVRIGADKASFYQGTGLIYHRAYPVSNDRFGIFLDSAHADKDFFYQIYVKEAKSSKEIYSDVFSFRSNR
ncbi:hypothetical protein GZH53_13450 [Flavihumibacter sp. R14]|nr:hypothetical protein [Flavihumibacter soli]